MEVESTRRRVLHGIRYNVRKFRPQDADALKAISSESPEASNWSKESYLTFAQETGSLALVSIAGRAVIGFFVGRLVGDQAEVLNLAVSSRHRRKGLASVLLSAALRDLQSKGAKSVYLEVRESNTPAIAFYCRHGFIKTGLRKRYYRQPDEAAVTMMKELTG